MFDQIRNWNPPIEVVADRAGLVSKIVVELITRR